jgi:5-methylcytosine-specific restriction protein A
MTRKRLSARERERIYDSTYGCCDICLQPIWLGERWEVSHRIPLAAGGEDAPENRFPVHYKCHRRQTAEVDAPLIAKTRRQRQKALGIRSTSRPMPGSRASGWRRRMDGTTERRP